MLIVLMYAVRPRIPRSIRLNIHNQCLNIDLLYPAYIDGGYSECHRPPSYKVCAGDTMRTNFMIDPDTWHYGALIYRLKRRQSYESTEDASSATHLLVGWGLYNEDEEFRADVLLIEHDKRFIWDRNDLRKLNDVNPDMFRVYSGPVTKRWLLSDNVALMAEFRIMKKSRIWNITISEVERNNNMKMPIHIGLKG
jgi:hypothetical protein